MVRILCKSCSINFAHNTPLYCAQSTCGYAATTDCERLGDDINSDDSDDDDLSLEPLDARERKESWADVGCVCTFLVCIQIGILFILNNIRH